MVAKQPRHLATILEVSVSPTPDLIQGLPPVEPAVSKYTDIWVGDNSGPITSLGSVGYRNWYALTVLVPVAAKLSRSSKAAYKLSWGQKDTVELHRDLEIHDR